MSKDLFLKYLRKDLKPYVKESDCCESIVKLRKEIERQNNIIKEVREILESKKHCERFFGGVEGKTFTEQVLEILEQGSDKE